jgi:hypothetical protein
MQLQAQHRIAGIRFGMMTGQRKCLFSPQNVSKNLCRKTGFVFFIHQNLQQIEICKMLVYKLLPHIKTRSPQPNHKPEFAYILNLSYFCRVFGASVSVETDVKRESGANPEQTRCCKLIFNSITN